MHKYTVFTVAPSGSEHVLWMIDGRGEHHVARATGAVPNIGSTLLGSSPALGFGLLLGETLEEVYRVIFEAVHCTQAEAHFSVPVPLTALVPIEPARPEQIPERSTLLRASLN